MPTVTPTRSFNKNYHDTEYGFPLDDDNLLFGRLVLEINQAALSSQKGGEVYRGRSRTPAEDAGIIRNRLKVNAAIVNAQRILELQREHASFKAWLDAHHPLTKREAVSTCCRSGL